VANQKHYHVTSEECTAPGSRNVGQGFHAYRLSAYHLLLLLLLLQDLASILAQEVKHEKSVYEQDELVAKGKLWWGYRGWGGEGGSWVPWCGRAAIHVSMRRQHMRKMRCS
jgi:hypothetical protein